MKIGIYGYGNLGRGVELAVKNSSDAELVGVFTRRDPKTVATLTGAPVFSASTVDDFAGKIDVMVICGGSATDLPVMTPALAEKFSVVDSFDNHHRIPEHFGKVDEAAKKGGNAAVISGGWDPGLFSLARLYGSAVLPDGESYTFWGRGVSQGHSDAVRRIEGVKDARQYTIPIPEALDRVRAGENPTLTVREKHKREVFAVLEEGADAERIENEIKNMPDYFADYDTEVHFITAEELKRDHAGLPHGGFVIRTGKTGLNGEHNEKIEFSLALDSNPEFTSSVLLALARGALRMKNEGKTGCFTVFDLPPAYLSPLSREEIIEKLL